MAKKKTTTAGKVVIIKQSAAPKKRRSSGSIIVAKAGCSGSRRRHHRRHGGGGGLIGGAATHSQILAPAIAGFAVAKLEDSGLLDKIPTLPLLGKKGTLCIAIHLFRPQAQGLIRDIKMFLAGLSGYELGKNGEISGVPDEVY